MSDPEIAVRPAPLPFLLLGLLSMPVSAQSLAPPDWTASTPIGASIDLGLRAMAVDPGGVTFVTADSGTSSDVDVLTAAFAADGSLSWQQVFDGPFSSHDQVRAMALGLGGIVWLTGNTANGVNVANVLLLGYEPTTGAQLQATLVPAAASESGASIAVDDVGNLYVAGHSGPDVLLIKFDPLGSLLWRKLWDGPAGGPFSLDRGLQVLIGPTGDPVVLAQGVMGGSLPDYVVLRFAAANGALQWVSNWGTTAAEYAHAMALDDVGDVYATGLAMDGVVQKFATIKLDGATGALLWQAFDHDGSGNSPAVRGICVDRRGGVYVTGSLDPDGNQSNHNDDFFTVRRDATSGALTWMHAFGASCIDCLDLPEDLAVDAAGNLGAKLPVALGQEGAVEFAVAIHGVPPACRGHSSTGRGCGRLRGNGPVRDRSGLAAPRPDRRRQPHRAACRP